MLLRMILGFAFAALLLAAPLPAPAIPANPQLESLESLQLKLAIASKAVEIKKFEILDMSVRHLSLSANYVGRLAVIILLAGLICGVFQGSASVKNDWGYLGGGAKGYMINTSGVLFIVFFCLLVLYGAIEMGVMQTSKLQEEKERTQTHNSGSAHTK